MSYRINSGYNLPQIVRKNDNGLVNTKNVNQSEPDWSSVFASEQLGQVTKPIVCSAPPSVPDVKSESADAEAINPFIASEPTNDCANESSNSSKDVQLKEFMNENVTPYTISEPQKDAGEVVVQNNVKEQSFKNQVQKSVPHRVHHKIAQKKEVVFQQPKNNATGNSSAIVEKHVVVKAPMVKNITPVKPVSESHTSAPKVQKPVVAKIPQSQDSSNVKTTPVQQIAKDNTNNLSQIKFKMPEKQSFTAHQSSTMVAKPLVKDLTTKVAKTKTTALKAKAPTGSAAVYNATDGVVFTENKGPGNKSSITVQNTRTGVTKVMSFKNSEEELAYKKAFHLQEDKNAPQVPVKSAPTAQKTVATKISQHKDTSKAKASTFMQIMGKLTDKFGITKFKTPKISFLAEPRNSTMVARPLVKDLTRKIVRPNAKSLKAKAPTVIKPQGIVLKAKAPTGSAAAYNATDGVIFTENKGPGNKSSITVQNTRTGVTKVMPFKSHEEELAYKKAFRLN